MILKTQYLLILALSSNTYAGGNAGNPCNQSGCSDVNCNLGLICDTLSNPCRCRDTLFFSLNNLNNLDTLDTLDNLNAESEARAVIYDLYGNYIYEGLLSEFIPIRRKIYIIHRKHERFLKVWL